MRRCRGAPGGRGTQQTAPSRTGRARPEPPDGSQQRASVSKWDLDAPRCRTLHLGCSCSRLTRTCGFNARLTSAQGRFWFWLPRTSSPGGTETPGGSEPPGRTEPPGEVHFPRASSPQPLPLDLLGLQTPILPHMSLLLPGGRGRGRFKFKSKVPQNPELNRREVLVLAPQNQIPRKN